MFLQFLAALIIIINSLVNAQSFTQFQTCTSQQRKVCSEGDDQCQTQQINLAKCASDCSSQYQQNETQLKCFQDQCANIAKNESVFSIYVQVCTCTQSIYTAYFSLYFQGFLLCANQTQSPCAANNSTCNGLIIESKNCLANCESQFQNSTLQDCVTQNCQYADGDVQNYVNSIMYCAKSTVLSLSAISLILIIGVSI
ncbi:hypothetical protein TTHERM_01223640 (macronuclear) [Tetrahymena thermophila SB210]|uniref:Transmembrane protein n=1 Tax=Tetrahymena thermophila (strain SB210) TaxID=312017 RepID=Q248J2_TETTS|nr:hypothetical protein TTHERM_01223640 [Tetrahymena thermophila SB210]EAS04193.1 hypothetical protein TTHERM_01223640 [Tetrahymena thermophila SB210]|eukprot:XP_001024438.1 hypothetical protein TTHERM_01223640 [Tetrahymena thermophila SB210]